MVTGVTPPWTPPDFSDQTARDGSLAFRNASASRDRRRVGQCKRRQRARPKAAFECSGSQAVNSVLARKGSTSSMLGRHAITLQFSPLKLDAAAKQKFGDAPIVPEPKSQSADIEVLDSLGLSAAQQEILGKLGGF